MDVIVALVIGFFSGVLIGAIMVLCWARKELRKIQDEAKKKERELWGLKAKQIHQETAKFELDWTGKGGLAYD